MSDTGREASEYAESVMTSSQVRTAGSPSLVRWAVILTVAASLIHGLNVKEHLAEWWGYGFFFLFAAAAQFVYGLILIVQPWNYDQTGGRRDGRRYARHFYRAGIAANVFLIGLYLLTRTVGVPFFGPAAGTTEPFTPVGVATKLVEAGLVAVLVTLVRRDRSAHAPVVIIERSNERGS
jgi:hypothetical protein